MDKRTPATQLTRIALVGNPNCGKTSLFNALTGSTQKVANYPGVTVERKEGMLVTPQGRTVTLLDLPGTYSLRGRSPDEVVTRDIVLGNIPGEDIPEIILCVADSSNLRLALRLALELREVGKPIVLVLNMSDIATHRGFDINMERLSTDLGIPVVSSTAVRRGGIDALLAMLDNQIELLPAAPQTQNIWSPPCRDKTTQLQCEADRILSHSVRHPHKANTVTARMDEVLLHPIWGMVILLAVLFVMFQAVFTWAQMPMETIKSGFETLGTTAGQRLPQGLLRSFVCDGLIGGVGAVIVFLPQIMILFLFILLLEDFGYMARAAFLMDKIMGGAGLHGRAFIPLLSSFACAIPAIMATRVIDNRRDRLTTILIAPLMTCSARIPVYTLIIAAFIPTKQAWGGFQLQGLVMFGLYALGIFSALGVSFLLRRMVWQHIPPEPFMLELPDYKIPNAQAIFLGVAQRAKAFLYRAGTTITAMMIVIWFLASMPLPATDATNSAINTSYAARIGKAMEPVFSPIGFNWQICMALIPGMAAREVAVAALGTVYSIESGEDTKDKLSQTLAHQWSLATALSLLAWYIFAPQCVSTLVTIRRETGSLKWPLFSFLYMMTLAYIASFITYRAAFALGAG